MGTYSKNSYLRSWTCLVLGSVLLLGGCARDASKNSRVTGQIVVNRPSPTGPSIPNPTVVGLHPGTVVDSSNEGGVDSVSSHQTTSGSLNLSKVSVGGSYQRDLGVSAHFKVMGGVYAR